MHQSVGSKCVRLLRLPKLFPVASQPVITIEKVSIVLHNNGLFSRTNGNIEKASHFVSLLSYDCYSLICLDFGGGRGLGVMQRLVIHFGIHKC